VKSRVLVYYRLAIVLLPAIAFVTCFVAIHLYGKSESPLDVARWTVHAGMWRVFLIPALAGFVIGGLDCFFPKRKTLLMISAIVGCILSVLYGLALTAALIGAAP